MICPICKVMGLKSTLRDNGGMTTCVAYFPFYDEDGNYHSHDGNNISNEYFCSNKHRFLICTNQSCPQLDCDWNKNIKKQIKFDEDGFSKEEVEQIKELVNKK